MERRNVRRKERNKRSDGVKRNEALEINSRGQEDSSEVFLIRPSLRKTGVYCADIYCSVHTER